MVKTLNIFIGYDLKVSCLSYMCSKILENTKCLVSIIPLHLEMLNNYKETHTDGSNCFIYSRFLSLILLDIEVMHYLLMVT